MKLFSTSSTAIAFQMSRIFLIQRRLYNQCFTGHLLFICFQVATGSTLVLKGMVTVLGLVHLLTLGEHIQMIFIRINGEEKVFFVLYCFFLYEIQIIFNISKIFLLSLSCMHIQLSDMIYSSFMLSRLVARVQIIKIYIWIFGFFALASAVIHSSLFMRIRIAIREPAFVILLAKLFCTQTFSSHILAQDDVVTYFLDDAEQVSVNHAIPISVFIRVLSFSLGIAAK